MLLNQVLSGNENQKIEEEGFLEITANSVKLKNDVYQFRNVTGFGVGDVKTKGIPLIFMIALFMLAIFSHFFPDFIVWSGLLWFILISTIIYNVSRPKLYGLSLYLNSGHETIFITEDIEFLRKTVRTLKDFMENPKPGKVINVTIGRDVKGNITFGDSHSM